MEEGGREEDEGEGEERRAHLRVGQALTHFWRHHTHVPSDARAGDDAWGWARAGSRSDSARTENTFFGFFFLGIRVTSLHSVNKAVQNSAWARGTTLVEPSRNSSRTRLGSKISRLASISILALCPPPLSPPPPALPTLEREIFSCYRSGPRCHRRRQSTFLPRLTRKRQKRTSNPTQKLGRSATSLERRGEKKNQTSSLLIAAGSFERKRGNAWQGNSKFYLLSA